MDRFVIKSGRNGNAVGEEGERDEQEEEEEEEGEGEEGQGDVIMNDDGTMGMREGEVS